LVVPPKHRDQARHEQALFSRKSSIREEQIPGKGTLQMPEAAAANTDGGVGPAMLFEQVAQHVGDASEVHRFSGEHIDDDREEGALHRREPSDEVPVKQRGDATE